LVTLGVEKVAVAAAVRSTNVCGPFSAGASLVSWHAASNGSKNVATIARRTK
jgi:hypothetical protein